MLPFTLLRAGFFAQNLADAYRLDIVEDDRIYVPAGDGRVAFVDARDLGDVAATVLGDPAPFHRGALELTGPEALGLDEVARIVGTSTGRDVRYEAASVAGYALHLRRRRHLPWRQIVVQTVLHVGLRGGDAERVTSTVPSLLGRPATSLREYVERERTTWWRGVEMLARS